MEKLKLDSDTVIVIPARLEGTWSNKYYKQSIHELIIESNLLSELELQNIQSNIGLTLSLLTKEVSYPILVISDWPGDDTWELVQSFIQQNPNNKVSLIQQDKNYWKWQALLTAKDLLPEGVSTIIMTDADILLPNWFVDQLLQAHKEFPDKAMIVSPVIGTQTRNWAANDLVIKEYSWTRLLNLPLLDEHFKDLWDEKVIEVLAHRKLGLETALNLVCSRSTLMLQNQEYRYETGEQLPSFLPSARGPDGFQPANQDIWATKVLFHNYFTSK